MIGDPVQVINIPAVGDDILSFSIDSIPALPSSLKAAIIASRNTIWRHVQSLDRICHLGADLLSEPCRHIEPLDVDDKNIREAIELLNNFAFLVRLAALAKPGALF